MLTTIVTTALLGLALAQNLEETQFGTSKTEICPSGSIAPDGIACAAVANCGGSAKWLVETIQAKETEAEVALVPGRVVGQNALEIYAFHGAVNGRTVDKIVMNEDNANCNYPGPNWTKGVDASGDTCFDVYRSNIPWDQAYVGGGSETDQKARGCNLKREQNETHVNFQGVATVHMIEKFDFDGTEDTRIMKQIVQFRLSQPRTITDIKTEVTLLEDPRLLSAITEQSFDYVTGKATLKLKLSTADPLKTFADQENPVQITTTKTGVDIVPAAENPLIDVAGCDNSDMYMKGGSCLQDHTFTLSPNDACDFDGEYTFLISVKCREGVAAEDCPLDMLARPLEVKVTLDSENICEVVSGLLEVGAKMQPHASFNKEEFTFGPVKKAFFQSQTIHFKLDIDSLNGFPFASTELDEVRTQNKNGDIVVVYNKGDAANALWNFETSSSQPEAVQHTHQFQITPGPDSSFGVVLRNMPVDTEVLADVSLVFANSIGQGGKRKRTFIMKRQAVDNSKKVQGEANFLMEPMDGAPETDPNGVNDEESSASALTLCLATAGVALLSNF